MYSEQLKYIRLVKNITSLMIKTQLFFVYWSLYLFLFFTYMGYVFFSKFIDFFEEL